MASFGETFSKCSKCRVLVNVTTLRRLLCPFCGAVIKKASHANDAETALASAVGANFASEETAELRATADEHTMTPEQTSLHLPSIISTPNRLPSIAQPGFVSSRKFYTVAYISSLLHYCFNFDVTESRR